MGQDGFERRKQARYKPGDMVLRDEAGHAKLRVKDYNLRDHVLVPHTGWQEGERRSVVVETGLTEPVRTTATVLQNRSGPARLSGTVLDLQVPDEVAFELALDLDPNWPVGIGRGQCLLRLSVPDFIPLSAMSEMQVGVTTAYSSHCLWQALLGNLESNLQDWKARFHGSLRVRLPGIGEGNRLVDRSSDRIIVVTTRRGHSFDPVLFGQEEAWTSILAGLARILGGAFKLHQWLGDRRNGGQAPLPTPTIARRSFRGRSEEGGIYRRVARQIELEDVRVVEQAITVQEEALKMILKVIIDVEQVAPSGLPRFLAAYSQSEQLTLFTELRKRGRRPNPEELLRDWMNTEQSGEH